MADPRAPLKGDRLIALALAVATFAALGLTERAVGFVRDEADYFAAGQSYAAWFEDLARAAAAGRPLSAMTDRAIVGRFELNHEHPVLAKTLFGLSHLLFTEKLHVFRDAAGYRMPAWALSGLLSALLYLMAARLVSRRGGLFAVAAFWLAPRHFFHGHLACFDIPIAWAWLLTVYCYWRSLSNRRWAAAAGLAFGIALAIKHNAWFIPGVLAIHWALSTAPRAYREGRWGGVGRSLTPFAAMLTLGPAFFYLHWPYLWHDPWPRLLWYVSFHAQHINYPWEFFGRLLVEAPFPLGYAYAVTAVTMPLATLALMVTGALAEMGRFVATYLYRPARRVIPPLDGDSLLVLGNAFASLTVLSMPFVPIFGGVKHWLPSMPFLALLAARALERAAATLGRLAPSATPWLSRAAYPGLFVLALSSSAMGLWRNHPYGTSFYNELAGGAPGAATLGMHRQFWSNNVTGVLDWLNRNAPRGGRVFFHEVKWESYLAYRRAGMLRDDLQYAAGPQDSDLAVYQYMPEFRDTEFQIWQAYGTRTPAAGLYLDETPQIVVYHRR
jgi:4-amino-4-deoxy-L-arabinose transferase-like glycosyltransferase